LQLFNAITLENAFLILTSAQKMNKESWKVWLISSWGAGNREIYLGHIQPLGRNAVPKRV